MNKKYDDIPDLYQLEGMGKFLGEITNPNYEKSKIKLPFKMLTVGGSAISKKTNGVLFMITEFFQNTFDKIIICIKEKEPLYNWFTSMLPPGSWEIYEDEIPDIKSFYKKPELEGKQLLFIFDDMMNSKDHNRRILEYFLRARKLPKNGNTSMIYITQSFTGMGAVGRSLRQQMSLIMLKRINSMSTIDMLAQEFKFGSKSKQDLLDMYNYANDKPENFLLINIEADNPKEIFRKNLYEFLE
jgi:hypothetical protein